MKGSKVCLSLALFLAGLTQAISAAPLHFYLHNGDRVLFYGDSITEQRYYPVAIETYVRTRFPNLEVKFVDSAVGGARVTGNWAGPEDVSLARDVFPFKPTVITIMLGMNDAQYQPFNEAVFDTYRSGYEHIIESLRAHLPGVRIVLIEPTPWDDVTVKPSYLRNPQGAPGGYNDTLLHYCQFVKELGARHHLMVVDFNTPLVKLMQEAVQINPALAEKIIPGRIHPGATGELVMAQLLLKAWGAPSTVSDVQIATGSSSGRVKRSENTTVSNLKIMSGVNWNQTDDSLPYPIMTLHSTEWPQFPPDPFGRGTPGVFWKLPPLEGQQVNPIAALVVRLTGMYQQLDSERLRVTGLPSARYTLGIDGKAIGVFTREQLAGGINLSEYDTPMMEQADKVLDLVWKEMDVRFYGWRAVQLPLRNDDTPGLQDAVTQLLARLEAERDNLMQQEHAAAQPQSHHFELEPVTQ